MKRRELIVFGIVLLSFAVSICFYARMPERMASHWGAHGQVDGYTSKFWGAFLMPMVLVGLALFYIAIPRIDPLKANIEGFRKYYDGFMIVFFAFMLAVHLFALLWNLGVKIGVNLVLAPGIAMLFIVPSSRR